MDDAHFDDPRPHPYRLGYREGFRDGYDEAGQAAAKQAAAKKGAGGSGSEPPGASQDKPDATADGGDADKDNGHGGDDDADQHGDPKKPGKNGDEGKPPLYKRPFVVAAVLLVVLALLIGGIVFWRHSKHHESTDDAFIDGADQPGRGTDRGPGDEALRRRQPARESRRPAVDIDSRDDDARIAQARAQLATAEGQADQASAQIGVRRAGAAEADAAVRQSEAELTRAAQDLARFRGVDPQAIARQQVDAAEANERTARARLDAARMSARAAHAQVDAALAQVRAGQAQVEAARATLSNAELQGSYTHVVAPIAGRVAKRAVEPGNVIANGQALMALVSENLWVTANYKETQLTRMQPGQEVEIVVDAYPDLKFRGHVDSIQRATGAYFSSLPAENATGNYVKVVQRVPVKIVFDDDRLRNYVVGPGMSVSPDVKLP